MAEYTKTVWSDGDIITAEKMNKIENGIAEVGGSGGGGSTVVLDCTDLEHLPTLEPGLTEEYFLNNVLIKWTQYKIGDMVVPVTARVINISEYDGLFDIMSISSAADNTDTVKWGPALVYNPETGELIND